MQSEPPNAAVAASFNPETLNRHYTLADLPLARQFYASDVSAKYSFYPARPGADAHAGRRQSIPSTSIESCACVRCATPSFAVGQGKYPRSKIL